jgi:thiol-disulfide isomerase/thioredoxin
MKIHKFLFVVILFLVCNFNICYSAYFDEPRTLAIGTAAPDFSLPGVDGKTYSLSSFKEAKILVIIFTCNHCPTAQSYEERIIQLASDYKAKGVSVVAVMPNDPRSVQPHELDYSDIGDSFDEMKIRAKERQFNFPYLYDGETEKMSRAYGPIATPHVFIFDKERKLRYQGRIDDEDRHGKIQHVSDAKNAIEALLNNKDVPVKTTKVFGCSIKWSEKSNWRQKAEEEWAKEPVKLDTIDVAGLNDLIKNNSDKLRLVNVWATWCGPCVAEFPDLVTINRMYRDRDFEFISISTDAPEKEAKVLDFLKQKDASNKNYLFTGNNYKLIEAIDPNWKGALPYTILVEPGGKIVYSKEGATDPAELKKAIVDNHLIGRYY